MQKWFENNPVTSHLLLWMTLILIWLEAIHPNTIELDTTWLVVNNPILSQPFNQSSSVLQSIFFDFTQGTRLTLGAEYLPIRDLTVWLDWLLFDTYWTGHHLHSLLWYALSCSLFLSCNRILFGNTWIVWVGTLFFAVHPTHVESVVWLASRKDLVSLAFSLLALLLYLLRKPLPLISLIVMLAYWSKNTAIVMGPLLVLVSLTVHQEDWRKVNWWFKWLWVAVPLMIGLYITLQVGADVAMFANPRGDTPIETLNIAIQTWVQYGRMLLWPNQLSLFYAEPEVTSWYSTDIWIGFGLCGVILTGTWYGWQHNRLWTLALLTIPLGLLPVSQITPIQNLMADRYLLLPTIGLSWCLILLLKQLSRRSKYVPIVLGIWLLNLSWWTIDRISLFHSDIELWTDVVNKQPMEIRGWITLSALYREQGNVEKATQQIQEAIVYHPHHPKIALAKGMIALARNESTKAKTYFQQAWTADNTLREAGNNLALLLQKENLTLSIEVAKELTTVHPLYVHGWDVLGSGCLQISDYQCADEALHTAHRISPYHLSTLINLGSLAYLQEHWSEAEHWWRQALSIDPTHQYALAGLEATVQKQSSIDQP